MATIYDVAKKSGFSIATVSKVVNNKSGVSNKTRKKIQNIMDELDYFPNMAASALMGKNTKTIGLLIPDLSNPFFADLAKSIEIRAHDYGYNIIICSTEYNEEKERKYIMLLKQKNIDGFVFVSGFENSIYIEKLLEQNFPLVAVARDFPNLEINSISLDDYRGGYQAASYLINNGHKNLVILAHNVWSNRERVRGFVDASNAHEGVEFTEILIDDITEGHVENGYNNTKHILDTNIKFTGIFACSDLMAIGSMKAIKDSGLKIPDSISIIGFDNSKFTKVSDPPLTTIVQPLQDIGIEVMDLIIKNVNDKDMSKKRINLLPKILERDSVKKRTN
ncbi:LacI family DNA-binding transcriptional regulator [Salinicoccus sp. YB14-2]|uniref:LacI family DNA-binding transcriptional regulator n=1 Tax=Salinicoccus sp. YB14-2 TaxID=1572701 RepID=UPI00068FCFFA|nr:LacI family DNA-binding transcriptional regulator [Salinicoccus sp. YB14-2]